MTEKNKNVNINKHQGSTKNDIKKSLKKYVKNLKNILTKTQKDVKIRKYQATDKKV